MEQKYTTLSANSVQSEADQLILPAVINPNETQPFAKSPTSENKQVKDAIKQRDDALSKMKLYRNLAEKMRMEKRQLKYHMDKRVEVVRDFWRTKIFEGDSRAGRMITCTVNRNN